MGREPEKVTVDVGKSGAGIRLKSLRGGYSTAESERPCQESAENQDQKISSEDENVAQMLKGTRVEGKDTYNEMFREP